MIDLEGPLSSEDQREKLTFGTAWTLYTITGTIYIASSKALIDMVMVFHVAVKTSGPAQWSLLRPACETHGALARSQAVQSREQGGQSHHWCGGRKHFWRWALVWLRQGEEGAISLYIYIILCGI